MTSYTQHIKAGTTKIPDKIMVWGCFSYRGIGKLIVLPKNETINKKSHLKLLSDHFDLSNHKQ